MSLTISPGTQVMEDEIALRESGGGLWNQGATWGGLGARPCWDTGKAFSAGFRSWKHGTTKVSRGPAGQP